MFCKGPPISTGAVSSLVIKENGKPLERGKKQEKNSFFKTKERKGEGGQAVHHDSGKTSAGGEGKPGSAGLSLPPRATPRPLPGFRVLLHCRWTAHKITVKPEVIVDGTFTSFL